MEYQDVVMMSTAKRLIVVEKFLKGEITNSEFQNEMIAIANREGRLIVEKVKK